MFFWRYVFLTFCTFSSTFFPVEYSVTFMFSLSFLFPPRFHLVYIFTYIFRILKIFKHDFYVEYNFCILHISKHTFHVLFVFHIVYTFTQKSNHRWKRRLKYMYNRSSFASCSLKIMSVTKVRTLAWMFEVHSHGSSLRCSKSPVCDIYAYYRVIITKLTVFRKDDPCYESVSGTDSW